MDERVLRAAICYRNLVELVQTAIGGCNARPNRYVAYNRNTSLKKGSSEEISSDQTVRQNRETNVQRKNIR
jgi:hypothetical protein